MAAATGNRVFATAGSDDKVAACKRLGAAEAFNYKTQDFEKEILKVTGGKGVDVILDMVGGDYVPKELKCIADDGRLVAKRGYRDPSFHRQGHHVFPYALLAGDAQDGGVPAADESPHPRLSDGRRRKDVEVARHVRDGVDVSETSRTELPAVLLRLKTRPAAG